MSEMACGIEAAVRLEIYESFLHRGRAPSPIDIARALRLRRSAVEDAFRGLAAAKVIVLDPGRNSIRMAHPFCAAPTPFRVRGAFTSYFANCAWDALGIAAMLGGDAECFADCPDCGEPVDLR